jgi:hypothetical protein
MAKTVIEAEVKTNVGEVAKDMSFMGVSLGSMKAGFSSAGKSAKMMFGTIKAGIISSGIGALLLAVLALGKYFTSTEEGASKLKQVFAALGIIVGNVEDVLSALGKSLVEAFENPQQAVKDLWEAIKTNIVNRFTGLIDSFEALGKVIKSALTLDWDGVKEGAAEFGESMVQTATGVDELFKKATETIKEFGEQTRKEMGQAIELEKALLSLQQKERKNLVAKAELEMKIAGLRADAKDMENFTSTERLEMTKTAIALSKEQLAVDLEIAEEKLRQQVLANSFSNSSADDLNAEAQLEADLFNLKKNNFALMKGFAGELKALNAEIRTAEISAAKEISDKIKADEKARIVSQKLDLQAFTDWKLTRIKDETDEEFKIRIEATKKTAAAQKIIDTKAAADKKALDKLVVDTKLETEKMGFAAAKSIGGENAAIQQGIAVAETIYNTQQAMMKAMTLPPPYGQIQAALTGIMGAKAIQTILSTSPSGGSVGGGAVATATPDPQMMSGSFSLGQGQEVQPMQAYVVSDDITNNQNKLAIIRRRATI